MEAHPKEREGACFYYSAPGREAGLVKDWLVDLAPVVYEFARGPTLVSDHGKEHTQRAGQP